MTINKNGTQMKRIAKAKRR